MLIDNKVLHIHIPRTGGRYVKELFESNNYKISFFEFEKTFRGKEVAHLTFPEYEYFYDHTNYNKFSIIRDPLDRFLSAINTYGRISNNKIKQIFRSQEDLNCFINNSIYNDCSNWLVPQINFLTYDTKLYRYEEGLGDEFTKWLLDNFNFSIIRYNYLHNEIKYRTLQLSEKQKDYVKNYYYKDYKLLDY